MLVVVRTTRVTSLRNREGTIQASDTVMCLARIVRVIEPAFAVEQELVGVLPDREVHRLSSPESRLDGPSCDPWRTPAIPVSQNLQARCGMVVQRKRDSFGRQTWRNLQPSGPAMPLCQSTCHRLPRAQRSCALTFAICPWNGLSSFLQHIPDQERRKRGISFGACRQSRWRQSAPQNWFPLHVDSAE